MKNVKSLVTFVGTVMAGRTALSSGSARRATDGDRLELLDALLNAAVLVTGTHRHRPPAARAGEDEA